MPPTSTTDESVAIPSRGLFVAACLSILFWAYQVSGGARLNLFETGTLVAGGVQSLEGKALYSHVFAFYGPLAYWLPGMASLAGGALGVLVYDALLRVACSLVSYSITARLSGRPWWALITPAALTLLGSTTSRTIPALAAILCLIEYERTGSHRWLRLTGALAGVALLWYQDAGAWLLASLVIVGMIRLVRSRRPTRGDDFAEARSIALGLAIVLVPVAAYFTARGALKAWLYQCFIFPNTTYSHRSATGYLRGLVNSWNGTGAIHLVYDYLFYVFPYVFVFVASACALIFVLLRSRRRFPASWAVMGVFALLELRLLSASFDEAKLYDTAPPAVILIVAFSLCSTPSPRPKRRRPTAIVALLALAWVCAWATQVGFHSAAHSTRSVAWSSVAELRGYPLGAIDPPTTTAAELSDVIRAVDRLSTKEQSIFVAPTAPYVYALAARRDATRFDYLDPVYIDASADAEIARSIRIERPAVVVLADNMAAGSGLSGADTAPRTYREISINYVELQRIGHWTLMVPRQSPMSGKALQR